MSERGEGRTTAQMLAAPHGAIYIWPVHSSLSYAKSLAQHIGRVDLAIAPIGWLSSISNTRGCRSPVVIDHGTLGRIRPGSEEHAGIEALRHRGRLAP